MQRGKNGTNSELIAESLRSASWHVSNAMALAAYAPKEEVHAGWLCAAAKEEIAAFLLDTEGREIEAAAHRISAASCYEEVEEYQQALTLLHAALSIDLRPVYRVKIEKQLKDCLAKARKQLRKSQRKTSASAVR